MNKRKRKKENQKILFHTPETGWVKVRLSAQNRRIDAKRLEKNIEILANAIEKYKGTP